MAQNKEASGSVFQSALSYCSDLLTGGTGQPHTMEQDGDEEVERRSMHAVCVTTTPPLLYTIYVTYPTYRVSIRIFVKIRIIRVIHEKYVFVTQGTSPM